eukprot:366400-Chlamydomonas_euryale.AAC.9
MPLLPLLSPPTSAAVPVLETDSERCSPAGSGGGWGSDTTAALKRMPKVAWRTVRPTSEEPALSVACNVVERKNVQARRWPGVAGQQGVDIPRWPPCERKGEESRQSTWAGLENDLQERREIWVIKW